MNEIIKVTLDDEHDPIVSGRQLHEALEVKNALLNVVRQNGRVRFY